MSQDTTARPGDKPENPFIALIGNPNAGKTALFNALTGLQQKVANFPGVTVDWHEGSASLPGNEQPVRVVDLPGTYSLSARSPDEMLAVDALFGQLPQIGTPELIVVVVDATNLRRNLFLVSQLLELDIPLLVALNMSDLARKQGLAIDADTLSRRLGVRVVPTAAARNEGIDALRRAIAEERAGSGRREPVTLMPQVDEAATALLLALHHGADDADKGLTHQQVSRALIDEQGHAESWLLALADKDGHPGREVLRDLLEQARESLGREPSLAEREARRRYDWIAQQLDGVVTQGQQQVTFAARLDRWIGNPLIGSLVFLAVITGVFQAVFAWAVPLMDAIDGLAANLAGGVHSLLGDGALASLLADGVISGVGSVVIFLPQILILFAFIIVLEDCGYMARAAFLMDRLMRFCGLSGQSFIPMLSSFACAVPGIMGTRVIRDPRDRLATILAAPFMTCSARLPVYALLIAAFVPAREVFGFLNLQGLVLLGLYLLGIAGGIATAWLAKRSILRGPTPIFMMEMPPFRLPDPRSVLLRLLERGRTFLVRAGTVIFSIAVVIWALAYFPHYSARQLQQFATAGSGEATLASEVTQQQSVSAAERAALQLEYSLLGRMGRTVQPLFQPLGWDWRITAGVIASFPAREVVVATLGTIYAVGSDDGDPESLAARLRQARHADGSLVFTLPMVIGLLVFYAFCLQCAATVVTIWRESGSWRWPVFAWTYMTGLAYLGALLCYQLGTPG